MMSNNSDNVNNLLNQLAYVDLHENCKQGANLIVALRDSGAEDLADALETAGYGDYVIKDYENQNATNGFVAIAIEDPKTGDVGISFRGTENLPEMGDAIYDVIHGNAKDAANNQIDMIDNISTAVTGDSIQAQEALDFFQRNQSESGNNYLYGHSKGGELALEVYVENSNKIEKVHIINPQPINWASLTPEQKNALNNGKIDAVVIDGDLVWLLGGVSYPVRIIKNNGSNNGEFFGPHDLHSASYDPKTGEAILEPNPYRDYFGQGLLGSGLTVLVTLIQGGYEIGQTCIDWIEDAYQFFTEEIPEHALQFWESVEKSWQAAKDYSCDIMENVEIFFTDMSESAKNWWSEHFGKDASKNASNSASSSGPCCIRVDTQHLQQAATCIVQISHNLDALEKTLGDCVHTIQSFSFAASVAIRASLRGTQQQIRDLSNNTECLANALTDISEIYEQSENLIRNVVCP